MSCLLVTVVLTLGAVRPANGQDTVGGVGGAATSDEDGTPIAFALVRLLPDDSTGPASQQSLPNAQGQFHFRSVPPGAYRLQLLRIGYRPVLSPVIDVRAGETSEQVLRASMVGFPLPTVMVYAEGTCLAGDQVARDPYLTALWKDVRNGVEIRRAFDRGYRYRRVLDQAYDTRVPSRTVVRRQRADTVVNEPDSVDIREQRARARRASEG
jgi:Carboxypeptidase regulatory-like domain